MKQLEDIVDELQSKLNMKSKEIDQLKDDKKVLINRCIQLRENKDLNESSLEMISQSSVHDDFTSEKKDDPKEKDLEIFLQSTVPDSLREENAPRNDSEVLSQSYVPKPLKRDDMVCSKLK